MPAEHGSVQPGGLRREHIVAAAMVAAVTVVLGFASGFGVRDAGAAISPPAGPAGPAGPVTAQPLAPPAAGPPPAGAARPGGTQVGVRPGSQGAAGSGSAAASGDGSAAGAGPGSGFDFGDLPFFPPPAAGDSSARPGDSVPPAPQCTPGILDSLLAILAEVLGGVTPAQALADAGAVQPGADQPRSDQPRSDQPGTGAIVPGLAVDLPVLLPVGDRAVLVAGLVPLLDTVAQREAARRQAAEPQVASAAGARPLVAPRSPDAPAAGPPAAAGPADQFSALAAMLAPVGLAADPGTGIVDPLLAPVLGSLGCGGIVPAAPPGEGR